MSERTVTEPAPAACPVCGATGVTACEGLDGADHPGRLPFFDDRTLAALDLMRRSTT